MSGLVSASILLEQQHDRILILDEYGHVGGNHINWNTDQYTFDIGSLIFQDDSPLLRHLPELLPLYVPVNPRVGRLNPRGIVTQYPFSLKHDIVDRGPLEWVRIALSLVTSRLFRRKIRNAKDYAAYWIGPRLLRQSGLEHYMTRFYGVPPDQIDATFARKRMYWIRDNASLLRRMRRWLRPSARPAQSQQLVRPREGFHRLYAATVERLGAAGVEFGLGERLDRVSRDDGAFAIITSQRTITATRLISTIPLDRMLAVCGLSDGYELPTVTLLSLFFSFAGQRSFE